MQRALTTAWLCLRSWGLTAHLAFAALTTLVVASMPHGALAVPARHGVSSVLWPLAPVLTALPVPAVVSSMSLDVHRGAPRAYRLRLMATSAVILTSVSCATAPGLSAVLARNTLALLGLALLSARVLPASLSWTLVTLPPMASGCWARTSIGHRTAGPSCSSRVRTRSP